MPMALSTLLFSCPWDVPSTGSAGSWWGSPCCICFADRQEDEWRQTPYASRNLPVFKEIYQKPQPQAYINIVLARTMSPEQESRKCVSFFKLDILLTPQWKTFIFVRKKWRIQIGYAANNTQASKDTQWALRKPNCTHIWIKLAW